MHMRAVEESAEAANPAARKREQHQPNTADERPRSSFRTIMRRFSCLRDSDATIASVPSLELSSTKITLFNKKIFTFG